MYRPDGGAEVVLMEIWFDFIFTDAFGTTY